MSGIQAVQGTTTVNAAGTASFSVPQTGCITGVVITLSLVGTTHAAYLWSVSAPSGSGALISSATATAPTITPILQGLWSVILQGLTSGGVVQAVYMLPLDIPKVATTTVTGPLALPYLAPTTVATPGLGSSLFLDSTKAGALSAVDTLAVTRQVAIVRSGTTGNRPATTYLATGTRYFDTTLGIPVFWNGTNWVNSAGATV